MKTRKFYIGFSRNRQNGIASIALQKYMRKPYSHVFFELDHKNLFDCNTIFHSSMSSGVSYWSDINFDKSNIKTHLYEVEASEEDYKLLRTILHKHAGDHYAFWQNIGVIFVDFCKELGLNVKNPFRDNENCSELVFMALVYLHPELKDLYKPNSIRPDHIEEIMEKYNYKNVLSDG